VIRNLPLIAVTALVATGASHAQFVPGNEAVTQTPSGKKVELPSAPAGYHKVYSPDGALFVGDWRMVETDAGLVECTEPFARPGSCRPSTYGSQKLLRVWVVKHHEVWLQCQHPDVNRTCQPIFAVPPANLPVSARQ